MCGEQEQPVGVEWGTPQPDVEMPWDIDQYRDIDHDNTIYVTPYGPEPEGVEVTPAGQLLRDAANIVDGARNNTHGDKERSSQTIARFWTTYLSATQREAFGDDNYSPAYVHITPSDVAQMMVLLKIARSVHGEQVRDHYVDEAGYAAVAGELAEVENAW